MTGSKALSLISGESALELRSHNVMGPQFKCLGLLAPTLCPQLWHDCPVLMRSTISLVVNLHTTLERATSSPRYNTCESVDQRKLLTLTEVAEHFLPSTELEQICDTGDNTAKFWEFVK